MPQGTTFHIALGSMKLTPSQRNQLGKAINNAALNELAKLDLSHDLSMRIPKKEWLGIWIDRFREGVVPSAVKPEIPADLTKGTNFHVALGELKLSENDKSAISNSLRSATLAELNQMKLLDKVTMRRVPKEWLGIWIDPHGPIGPRIRERIRPR